MAAAAEHSARIARLREEMERRDIDFLVLGPSSDLTYATGFATKLSERLTLLILPRAGTPRLVMPGFELPAVAALAPLFETVPWGDGDDPAQLAAALLRHDGRSGRIAVGAQLPARFLLELARAGIPGDWVDGDAVMAPARARKSPAEIAALREAGRIADALVDDLPGQPLAGVTEHEAFRTAQQLAVAHGSEPLVTGLVAFGENSAAPHHHLSGRTARTGDTILVDIGPTSAHYRGDITRTLFLGTPGDEFRRVHELVEQANQAAFQRVAPGVPAEEIDRAAREHIARAGAGDRFLHRTGHGIGLDIHEEPYIVRGNTAPLEPGMVFTIEPGVYLEGRFGVRVEDVVLVTDDGAVRLNRSSHDIRVVS
jgi:Xaa-Pro aminopeptidase